MRSETVIRSCWPLWVMGGSLDFILNVFGWMSFRVLSRGVTCFD